MVKLMLALLVGLGYVFALYINQPALHNPVSLLTVPLWVSIALRAASIWGLLVFLARYSHELLAWLSAVVSNRINSEEGM